MSNEVVKKDSMVNQKSITELLTQLSRDSAAVARNQLELRIQGIREKIRAVRTGIILITIGAVVIFFACMSFCAALVIKLTQYMSPVSAAVVTGVALVLIGGGIAFIGYKKMNKPSI